MTEKPELATLVATLEKQQQQLQFSRFTNDDAWSLGSLVVTTARARGLSLTVDIRRHGQQLFHAALPGTSPDNDTWIERKTRVVNRFNDSSGLVGYRFELNGWALDEAFGAEPLLYAPYGGCFPIIVSDVGVIGTIAISGLPDDDHGFLVEVLEMYLEIARPQRSAASDADQPPNPSATTI